MDSNSESYTCADCGRVYKSRRTMTKHLRNETCMKPKFIKKGNFQCQLCDKLYSAKTALQRHIRIIHGKKLRGEELDDVEKHHQIITFKNISGWYIKF